MPQVSCDGAKSTIHNTALMFARLEGGAHQNPQNCTLQTGRSQNWDVSPAPRCACCLCLACRTDKGLQELHRRVPMIAVWVSGREHCRQHVWGVPAMRTSDLMSAGGAVQAR
jgi:hypothetical protein